MKIYKCDKLCTISDYPKKCEKCGQKTKYYCDVEDKREVEILASNLQLNKYGDEFKKLKEKYGNS